MKKAIKAFFMCFGMFTSIPCPYRPWDEESRPLMTSCLPFVGFIIGGIWALAAWVLTELKAPAAVMAAILMLLPYFVTGFIHLDGFMDCCDAILSRRDLEERRRILKDSHVGSFAVICLCSLFIICFALLSSISFNKAWSIRTLIFIPAVTRACAALAVSCLKPMNHSQYSGEYRKRVSRGQIAIQWAALAAILIASIVCSRGIIAIAASALGYGLGVLYGYRQLQGMSGDVSGFALVIGEALGIAALVII
jgi:adenosylcobinamide-GDP ribazoletransferase